MNKLLIIIGCALIYFGCDATNAEYKTKYENQLAITDSLNFKVTQISNNITLLNQTWRTRFDSLKGIEVLLRNQVANCKDSSYWFDYVFRSRVYPMLEVINSAVLNYIANMPK